MKRWIFFLIVYFSTFYYAGAASFDCSKASTSIEKMICMNAELSQADERLMQSYQSALNRSADKKKLVQQQRNWLKYKRNVCADVSCLLDSYKTRISELDITGISVRSLAQAASTITVTASGEPCPCGTHAGGFNAFYGNRKLYVSYSYNPNSGNPIEHPIQVYPIKARDLLCGDPYKKCPCSGYKMTLIGEWVNNGSFEAYKISIR